MASRPGACARRRRWLAEQGFGPDDPEADPEHGLALAQAASLAGRSSLGARRVGRVQWHRGREYAMPARCAGYEGYTLHGGTAVGEHDRSALERLRRYVARPALGVHRLHLLPDGNRGNQEMCRDLQATTDTPRAANNAVEANGQWQDPEGGCATDHRLPVASSRSVTPTA